MRGRLGWGELHRQVLGEEPDNLRTHLPGPELTTPSLARGRLGGGLPPPTTAPVRDSS